MESAVAARESRKCSRPVRSADVWASRRTGGAVKASVAASAVRRAQVRPQMRRRTGGRWGGYRVTISWTLKRAFQRGHRLAGAAPSGDKAGNRSRRRPGDPTLHTPLLLAGPLTEKVADTVEDGQCVELLTPRIAEGGLLIGQDHEQALSEHRRHPGAA